MRRSEINRIIKNAKAFMAEKHFVLPPWAYWGPEEWKNNNQDIHEITESMLGWDITDFGSGDFYSRGLLLFTLRNGKMNVDKKETPLHYHWSKMEDIINRGGGNLVFELYNSIDENKLDSTPVHLRIDGIKHLVNAGVKVILTPGESICLEQGVYHRFYGEPGYGKVLTGEVSMVNDDTSDNCFYESVGRFPVIEEDEEPLHLLVSDYSKI